MATKTEKKDVEKKEYECLEGSKTWEVVASLSCSIMMLLIGSAMGWNSPSLPQLQEDDSPIKLNPDQSSWLAPCIAAGQLIGPPISFAIIDKIGRKNTILVGTLPLMISWSMIALAESVMVLYIARFMSGVMLGIGYCVTAIYVGEISSTNFRGVANVFLTLMLNLGILMAYVIGACFDIFESAYINLAISVSFVVLFFFMPETPYYLMMVGKLDEAEQVLRQLRGRTDVASELESIDHSLKAMKKSTEDLSIVRLWSDRACAKGIYIVGLLSVVLYFGGFVQILTYSEKMIEKMGKSSLSKETANIIVGVVQTLSGVITSSFVDRVGRKPLLAMSGAMAGFFNLVIGCYYFLHKYTDVNPTNYSLIPLVSLFAVVFAFNAGILVVQSIFISEMFSPDMKALAVCIVTINGGLLYLVSTKVYLTVAESWDLGHAPPFFAFVVVCWGVTAWTYLIAPETKGKTMLEIQQQFQEKKNKKGFANGNCCDESKIKMLG